MATSSSLLSLAQYLKTSYSPDVDFVEGELWERNLGEYEHARLQWLIGAFFAGQERAWSIRGVTEQRIQVSPNRVRICDLALLRFDAPREKITTTPPLVCIEILSPEDRLSRTRLVLADYLAMGVENIWLIDPIYRAAWTFHATGLKEADPTNLSVPNTPVHLDLTEALAALD